MKAILFILTLCVFIPAHVSNSAVSEHRANQRNEINEYVDRAVHRVALDRAMRRVDRKLYALLTARTDSMERVLKNYTDAR